MEIEIHKYGWIGVMMNQKTAIATLVFIFILTGCTVPFSIVNITPTTYPLKRSETPYNFLLATSIVSNTEATEIPTSITQTSPASTNSHQLIKPSQYYIQAGTPRTLSNFLHPDAGCKWMGVGGQVFNTDGQPVSNLVVEVGGKLDGKEILLLGMTGGSPGLGAGGYEIVLSNHPVTTINSLHMRIRNLGGDYLTGTIFFNTLNSCDNNMILINLAALQINYSDINYFPFIGEK